MAPRFPAFVLPTSLLGILFLVAALPVPSAGAAPFSIFAFESWAPHGASWTSETWSDASEDLLFLGTGTVLQIYDVSNPAALGLLGEVDIQTRVHDIAVSDDGDLVAVGDREALVTLVDVTNRAQPHIAGTYLDQDLNGPTGHSPVGLDFGPTGSDLLYGAFAPVGLKILDVQDPSAPTLAGDLNPYTGSGSPQDLHLAGGYALLSDQFTGLYVIDVSNPAAPSAVDTQALAQARKLACNETLGRCLVARLGFGFSLVDIGVGGAMTLRGTTSSGDYPAGFALTTRVEWSAAGLAVVSDRDVDNGLVLFDVSNPDLPAVETSLTGIRQESVSVLGDVAFPTSDIDQGRNPRLRSVDIDLSSRGSTPMELDSVPLLTEATDVDFVGTTTPSEVAVSLRYAGVQLFDVSNPQQPVLRSSFRHADKRIESATLRGDALIATTFTNQATVLDVSDRANPVELSPYQSAGVNGLILHIEPWGDGTQALLTLGKGMEIVDFADPMNPVVVSTWDVPPPGFVVNRADIGPNDRVAVVGSDGQPRVWIVDFSNPAMPTTLGSFQAGAAAQDLSYDVAGRVFLVETGLGLEIWGVTDPSNPALLGSYVTPAGGFTGVSGLDLTDFVFLAFRENGVVVLDVTDPANPVVVDSVDTPGFAQKVDVEFSLLAVADGEAGVRFWSPPPYADPIFSDGFESGDSMAWQ